MSPAVKPRASLTAGDLMGSGGLVIQCRPDHPPAPLEALASVVERLRVANGYRDPGAIRDLLSDWRVNLNILTLPTDYTRLAELTGLSVAEIHGLTFHRFAPLFQPWAAGNGAAQLGPWPLPLLPGGQVQRFLRNTRGGPVCPLCWAERPITLLPWSLRHVTTCPRHAVLLVDRCAGCGAGLALNIAKGTCARCRAPIAGFHTESIAGHAPSRALGDRIWAAIGYPLAGTTPDVESAPGEGKPAPAGAREAAGPLARLTPPMLFAFLWRFAPLMATRSPRYRAYDPLRQDAQGQPIALVTDPWVADIAVTHGSLVAVLQMLADWPSGWHAMLERRLAADGGATLVNVLASSFRREFAGPEWPWLEEEWTAFARDHGLAALVAAFGASAGAEAHAPDSGHVADSRPARHTQRIQALSVADVGQEAGLLASQVIHLARSGVLAPLAGDAGPIGPESLFARESVEAFLDAVGRAAPVALSAATGPDDPLDLGALTVVFERMGVPLDALLRAILAGELRVYREADRRELQALRATQAEVRAYLRLLAPAPASLMHVPAVCAFLHCRPTALRRWREAGLLVPHSDSATPGTGWTVYAGPDVAAFHALYVAAPEAAALIGCTHSALTMWAREGRIPVAVAPAPDGGHYRFDKVALLAWRANRLNVAEAMRALDVSRPTVYLWVEEGKIAPIGGKGVKEWWFDRRALAAWGAERITAQEAARVMGIHRKTFDRMYEAGEFARLDGSGPKKTWYSREAVLAWRRNRMTAAEVKEMLGIGHATLYRWVRAGQLTRLAASDSGQWWFDRERVDAVLRSRAGSSEGVGQDG